jgi:hypothetical protein
MHYKSSLNSTPLNTLQEKCNSVNPPPNSIDYTQLGGTLVPGTNFVKVLDKYPAVLSSQDYGTFSKCSAQCADDPLCTGFFGFVGGENDPNSTCGYFRKGTEFLDVAGRNPRYVSYMKGYIPDMGSRESPGVIKMTGATAVGSFTINNSATMSGTVGQCKSTCDSNDECGGFVRDSSLGDTSVGVCTWKSLLDTTPSFDEGSYPYPLTNEKVVADSTKNLWRKQPRKTPITGIDSSPLVYSADFSNFAYEQSAVNGYEIRRQKFPNGSLISTVKGTVNMCAKTCTATAGCNSFVHTAGIDDDQVAECKLYSGSTNKDSSTGRNAWLMDAFYKV